MKLYHTGFDVLQKPDIHFGRKNADFGWGFYLSDNRDFSVRWAKQRKEKTTRINEYMLDTEGLLVKHFKRDKEWFAYIFANRNNKADALGQYDVIIGPIANDTLYDIWGITTAGVLSEEQALELLNIGPLYFQVVIKSEKAARKLHWLGAEALEPETIAAARKTVAAEETDYQEKVEEKLTKITGIV